MYRGGAGVTDLGNFPKFYFFWWLPLSYLLEDSDIVLIDSRRKCQKSKGGMIIVLKIISFACILQLIRSKLWGFPS